MQDPRTLKVWHKAREMAVLVYHFTATLPSGEQFGLVAQMRRAAVSVGSNIAEGCGRRGDRELLRFLRIALGSVTKLEFQLVLTGDLDTGDQLHRSKAIAITDETKRMLTRLILMIERQERSGIRKGAHRAPSREDH